MTRFFALLAFGAVMAGSAVAETARPVLVELFANQNCPACPKAHRTMQEISEERDDIFILTWTVNYWDYLGEPDPMSLPKAKERQAAYTERLSLRAPYTPQSFYDGAKECPGTRKRDIRRNIKKRTETRTESVPVMMQEGSIVRLAGAPSGAYELTLVEYLAGDTNETSMVNPVTRTELLGPWQEADETFEVSCTNTCAVLLHKPNFGEVLAVQPLN
ncbi:MAG: DUF1223 domain-containing protein [Pseudomonadota bacterium]